MTHHPAPEWSDAELQAERDIAADLFIKERKEEGPEAYQKFYTATEPEVRRLFAVTNDLRDLTGPIIQANRDLLNAARYVAGPPVSADDLRTIVGDPLGRASLDEELAQSVAEAILLVVDPIRFPWLAEQRDPTTEERERGILWTIGLLAVERLRTHRRTNASKSQEDLVAEALAEALYLARDRRKVGEIEVMDQLDRGEFTKEVKVHGTKSDVPVRLKDGRFMPIECKVSNSSINSHKRLVRETGGKAKVWRDHFGAGQTIPAAVLAGVYDLSLLKMAQSQHHVTIFWQHDLDPLKEFVANAIDKK